VGTHAHLHASQERPSAFKAGFLLGGISRRHHGLLNDEYGAVDRRDRSSASENRRRIREVGLETWLAEQAAQVREGFS
jgi:hypothetical protein